MTFQYYTGFAVSVDNALDEQSTNAIQNKAVAQEFSRMAEENENRIDGFVSGADLDDEGVVLTVNSK